MPCETTVIKDTYSTVKHTDAEYVYCREVLWLQTLFLYDYVRISSCSRNVLSFTSSSTMWLNLWMILWLNSWIPGTPVLNLQKCRYIIYIFTYVYSNLWGYLNNRPDVQWYNLLASHLIRWDCGGITYSPKIIIKLRMNKI